MYRLNLVLLSRKILIANDRVYTSFFLKFFLLFLSRNRSFSSKKVRKLANDKKIFGEKDRFRVKNTWFLVAILSQIFDFRNFCLKIAKRLFLSRYFLRNGPFLIRKGAFSSKMNKNSRSKMTRKSNEILIICIKFLEMTIFDRNLKFRSGFIIAILFKRTKSLNHVIKSDHWVIK